MNQLQISCKSKPTDVFTTVKSDYCLRYCGFALHPRIHCCIVIQHAEKTCMSFTANKGATEIMLNAVQFCHIGEFEGILLICHLICLKTNTRNFLHKAALSRINRSIVKKRYCWELMWKPSVYSNHPLQNSSPRNMTLKCFCLIWMHANTNMEWNMLTNGPVQSRWLKWERKWNRLSLKICRESYRYSELSCLGM